MKSVLAAILMMAATPLGAQETALSPAQFRDRIAALLAQEPGVSIASIDATSFRLKATDGSEMTVNIGNGYARYRAEPLLLAQILDSYVTTLRKMNQSVEEPVEQLIPIVRPSSYIRQSTAPGADLSHFPPSRPMAGDLAYFLAVDSASAIRSATVEDLARWKLDGEAAWARAIANIGERVGELGLFRLGDESGPLGVGAASGLAPSILADPKRCGPGASGDLVRVVVLLYDRENFLMADTGDAAELAAFWKTAKVEVAAHQTLSETPLLCRDGHWEAVPIPWSGS